jgi:hypothetical protein
MEQTKNFDVAVNHKYFTNSLLKLIELIDNKSIQIVDMLKNSFENGEQSETDFKNTKKYKAHMKLQETCKIIKNGFSTQDDSFDQGKIIKKVYKVLTSNLDKFFPNADISLFQIKNDNGEVVTIIPGLDINLIIKNKQITEDDMKQIWGNLYMMYISSANMISSINENKKNEQVKEIIPKMREKVVEMGLVQNGGFFNPFIGLNVETGEYDVQKMFSNVEIKNPTEGSSMEDMLKMTGVEKLFNVDELRKQLKDIKEEDMAEATKNITKLIGAEGDKDVNEICDDLVKNVVQDLQNDTGSTINIFDIAKSVADRVGNNMKRDKFNKTADHFNKFMNNSQNNLKDLKDENGNPIGEKLMNSLNIPLQLAKMMGQQKPQNNQQFAKK